MPRTAKSSGCISPQGTPALDSLSLRLGLSRAITPQAMWMAIGMEKFSLTG